MNLAKEEERKILQACKQILWVIYTKKKLDMKTVPIIDLVARHIDKIRAGLPVFQSAKAGAMMMAAPEVVRDTQIFLTIAPQLDTYNKTKSELWQYNSMLDAMEEEIKINNKAVMSPDSMPKVYQYFHKLHTFLERGYE